MYTVSLLTFALAGIAHAKPEEDRVLEIPDMAVMDKFGYYSGYVGVPNTGKKLHYIFVESQSNPETDPLVLWFNGGPGCSSLLGWSQEHGPYSMDDGTNFWRENEYSWNKEANVIYLESPAGVGYSTCSNISECRSNDDISADDNLAAVLAWYAKFPEYQGHELYITGESYAGIYVPYLTQRIDAYNTAHAADDTVFKPNLAGFAVGNGVTNWDLDCNSAWVEQAYYFGFYPAELRAKMVAANCDFSGRYMQAASTECMGYFSEFSGYT